MADSAHAIQVESVTKSYRIWNDASARIEAGLVNACAALLPENTAAAKGLRRRVERRYRDFYALQDVSMHVDAGETVGIIGLNGSGKSTLLQLIAGIVQPTRGTVAVRGRVAALLELGSGFNPEFTGHENVYLNGAILGLSRHEVDERFDRIAAFADIGDFINQPVKTYSSGMFVRLAFAVATNVSADILLIDEALTVGDIFFQQKCYAHLNELRSRGVAIVLVTHGMMDVEQFCHRAYLLHRGRLHAAGPAPEVVKHYYLLNRQRHPSASVQSGPENTVPEAAVSHEKDWPPPDANMVDNSVRQVTDGDARLTYVAVCDRDELVSRRFEQGEFAVFYYEFELLRSIEVPVVGVVLSTSKGIIAHGKSSLEYGSSFASQYGAGQRLRFRHEIKLELAVGEYTFEVGIASLPAAVLPLAAKLSHFELAEQVRRHCHVTGLGPFEIAFRTRGQPVQLLHHGVANLPGAIECLTSSRNP